MNKHLRQHSDQIRAIYGLFLGHAVFDLRPKKGNP